MYFDLIEIIIDMRTCMYDKVTFESVLSMLSIWLSRWTQSIHITPCAWHFYLIVIGVTPCLSLSHDQVREAWDKIGEYHADRFKWKKAAQYFQQSRNLDRLADCYYRLENFAELAKLSKEVGYLVFLPLHHGFHRPQ